MPGIIKRLVNPLLRFMNDSRAIGITLLACTFISLIVSNSSWGNMYTSFWKTEIHLFQSLHLPHTIVHFINDGLMVLFFFLAGMEIKRELLQGELSSFKNAALPFAAAIGGMIVPAFIYLLFNKGSEYAGGWAIPSATDIAFSLGVASLLGKRVPVSLKVFLTALAIIDDLGAIIIIALVYGESVHGIFLLLCTLAVVALYFLQRLKIKFGFLQIIIGIMLWYCMYNSGIHATVAGVVFAFFVPLHLIEDYEHRLHRIIYFVIVPLFALANTAILISAEGFNSLGSSLAWGIMLGLFVGKPIGIFLACRLLVNGKIAELPAGTTWQMLFGAATLAGIGFTMSIFISVLAFASEQIQDTAKIAVLLGSFAAICTGYILLRIFTFKKEKNEAMIA